MKALVGIAAAAVIAAAAGASPVPGAAPPLTQQFDHAKHEGFGCTTCHADVAQGQVYPDPSFCASCHDGQLQPRVNWQPPTGPSPANLKFRHAGHPAVEACDMCHVSDGMVQRAVIDQCMACHGIAEHQNAAVSDCSMCHVQPPAPPSHAFGWRDRHRAEAVAAPEQCATCHVRADCLDCHRPDAASPVGGYHGVDYLQRHPAASYNRETECSSCHNVSQFCQSCHQQAGLVSRGAIGAGYHDGNASFIAGHAQAARQNLESCVACHTERDCLRCHVSFNPHGPGFDPGAYAGKNQQVCTVCHTAVPNPG